MTQIPATVQHQSRSAEAILGRETLEALVVPGLYLALDGRITAANALAQELLAPDQALEGRLLESLSWWSESEDLRKKLRSSITSAAEGTNVVFTLASGPPRATHHEFKIARLGSNSTSPRLLATIIDQTEWTRAEQQLRASHERLETAARVTGFGTYETIVETRETYWSRTLYEIWGLDQDTELTPDLAWNIVHPDDLHVLKKAEQKSLNHPEPFDYEEEFRIIRPDGQLRWVRDTGQTEFVGTGKDRRLYRFVGTVQDITAQKESQLRLKDQETEFRNLANSIPQLAWMADEHGEIFWYNSRWFDYTGALPASFVQAGWSHFVDPQYRDEVMTKLHDCLRKAEQWEDTFPVRSRTHAYRWFLARAFPIRDTHGELRRWFATFTDVTDHRETSERLRKLTHRLSEAHRRKDEFLATLAHEIRNPLMALRSGIDLIRTKPTSSLEHRSVIDVLDRQTQQLVKLGNDLLDVARISRGKFRVDRATIALQEPLQDAIESMRGQIDHRQHRLELDIPAEPLWADCDKFRMTQVFSNLLHNATKFTPELGTITVSARHNDKKAIVTVADTGIGLAGDCVERIFELSSQQPQDDAQPREGLGLGLTLVNSIVQMHGGSVSAASDGRGQGTTITVRLPLAAAPVCAPRGASTETAHPAAKRRILIVDDNRDITRLLVARLKHLGHEVHAAHDGHEGIAVAEVQRPDVIFMDIGMPEMDGYQTAQRLRQTEWGQRIKLVALTGWGTADDRRRSAQAGGQHHLVKPADLAQLQNAIDS